MIVKASPQRSLAYNLKKKGRTLKEIRAVQNVVQSVLYDIPETRDNDTLLYLEVCSRFNPIAVNMPFANVLKNRSDFNLPKMESVRRSRQKLQSKYEKLRPSREVAKYRAENCEIMREYANEI